MPSQSPSEPRTTTVPDNSGQASTVNDHREGVLGVKSDADRVLTEPAPKTKTTEKIVSRPTNQSEAAQREHLQDEHRQDEHRQDEHRQDEQDQDAVTAGTNDTNDTTGTTSTSKEIGGRDGLDPVRYGDWEKGGRCIDF